MGIRNLLRELKPIIRHCDISEFSGKICGIDASVWLHRAAYSCASKLIFNKNTNKYIEWILNSINKLKYYNIKPIMVFDGEQLPMKANEEEKRNNLREINKQFAIKAYKNGNISEGFKYATRAIQITSEMITKLINRLKKENISFVVAPYEGILLYFI